MCVARVRTLEYALKYGYCAHSSTGSITLEYECTCTYILEKCMSMDVLQYAYTCTTTRVLEYKITSPWKHLRCNECVGQESQMSERYWYCNSMLLQYMYVYTVYSSTGSMLPVPLAMAY